MAGLKIGLDIGTFSIKASIPGKGVVLNEPSVLACDSHTRRPLAFGRAAFEMLGRAPASVTVKRLIEEGKIADYEYAELALNHIIKKLCGQRLLKPHLYIAQSSEATELERLSLCELAAKVGAADVCLIDEALAAAFGSQTAGPRLVGIGLADIGAGKTDACVLSMGKTAVSSSFRIAGDKMTAELIEYFKSEREIEISFEEAERVKLLLACAHNPEAEIAVTVGGKLINDGQPLSVEVSNSEVYYAIRPHIAEITEGLRLMLEQTPPELSGDISENGLVLTGGTAELNGLAELLQRKLKIPVERAAAPSFCVCNGLEKIIKNNIVKEYGLSRIRV